MDIIGIFRSAPVPKILSETESKISASAKNMMLALKSVKNDANAKGIKVERMYEKTESSARKLIKNTARGNIKAALKDVKVYEKRSGKLFENIGNPFYKANISVAERERLFITTSLYKLHYKN